MPDIAVIHPQVVHFVVALAFVGVGARLASLLPLGMAAMTAARSLAARWRAAAGSASHCSKPKIARCAMTGPSFGAVSEDIAKAATTCS